ncbi:MAG: cupin domain-containing protein [Candidatus Bathyarchaeota archaeon]|nr:cupin domain-containing protein [Candidatus Bathyarchaeota archaeon]
MNPIIRRESDLPFNPSAPFPTKILLSKRDMAAASVRLSMLGKDDRIDVHSHEDNDQIEYCIKGKAIMFIEGLGEKEIGEGTFTYVPKGVRHSLIKVIEPITILTVFVPPLF